MEILVSLWRDYPALVDLALYFFVFAATSRAALARVFPGRTGRALAVSVGLVLAGSLVLAQTKLGFSLETLGPVAVFVLCLVVFLVSYRLMHHARLPLILTLLLAGLLALVLFRFTLPDLTGRWAQEYSGFALLGLIGVVAWAWQGSEGRAHEIERRKPGPNLARQRMIPNPKELEEERSFVKRRIRRPTRQDRKDESVIQRETKRVESVLGTESLSSEKTREQLQRLEEALQRSQAVRKRSQSLLKLDDALRRFDLGWLQKATHVDLQQLTPTQQLLLRKSMADERRRVVAEEKLGKLEAKVSRFSEALEQHVEKARDCLSSGNAPEAQAWIVEAQSIDRKILELDAEALTWEQRLIKFIRLQAKEISQIG